MTKQNKNINAGLIVSSAFIGAFISRWIDKILVWRAPWDLIGLIVMGIFVFFLVRTIWGKYL